MAPAEKSSWIADFPHFGGMDAGHVATLLRESRSVQIHVDSAAFQPGEPCRYYILVRQGSIRVSLIDRNGHEIVLYRLARGESCVLTTAALLADAAYEAIAVAETTVEAILIPRDVFLFLLGDSADFRKAVLADHGSRILSLMGSIGKLAFESIDTRLVQVLLELAGPRRSVSATHEAIALEVGTAREVVSRRLKHFEQIGWVKLHRGQIEILQGMSMSLKETE